MKLAAPLLFLMLFGAAAQATATLDSPPIAFVPLDDRPVTYQLPKMLGTIAGTRVLTPPRALLGHYLRFGDPDGVLDWLASPETREARAFVLSTDMLAYGGLVASRVPGVPDYLAISRLRRLADLHAARPAAWFGAFGTIMRLAPTGVPALGEAASFFAAGPAVDLIAEYANLPDPPASDEARRRAAALREAIGATVLERYLATRARNLSVDEFVLQLTAEGTFDRIALGQDDAGPQGLHLRDVRALQAAARRFDLGRRSSLEPGADELGMALVANALARSAAWTPRVTVHYSRADGALVNDPLEYAPIATTIEALVDVCGGRLVADAPDIALFVRVNATKPDDERSFADAIAAAVGSGISVAVADLTFLDGPADEQRALTETLIGRGVAGKIDAFASWNTAANTVGTALGEAIAAGVGKRLRSYDAPAHAQFMLDRYADDYAFHQFVRPALIAALKARGVNEHTYLLPEVALQAQRENRALLWPHALALLRSLYPEYRNAGLTIRLPWDRTFETELDVRLSR